MSRQKEHNKQEDFFNKIEIPYSKSKNDVWNAVSESLENDESGIKNPVKNIIMYSAAAVLLFLIGMTGFMRFYSNEFYAHKGQHLSAILPDGSEVNLNAQTYLSYHPYWWRFSREAELKGEAFFKVKKGKRFAVISDEGTTSVLGTSFNIFARQTVYKVHCITGKVQVISRGNDIEILKPKQSLTISDNKIKTIRKDDKINDAVAWIDNRFVFTGTPLNEVFEELERQFDIHININDEVTDLYSGNFKRGSSPDEILDIICKPLGLTYKKVTTNTYEIKKQ